ncbi:MAG: class I SAM-dependent methyltransferase [Stigonema ocellatum SAG 48.90 = DSM 106950]|nr:class I SAM-dependent methyltransferase [Stigonema ocellatum SAG 48.90 = DSM 106950]
MNTHWQKDYPLVSNLSEADLDENSSLKKMSRLVGENKRLIDFGCATGYLAQLLVNKGCQVTGVEVNSKAAKVAEEYCEEVIVADLDFVSVAEIVPGQVFDVAVFGDILEHLRDPWKVLEETRHLLKPEGYVVASIPNIAHGAIRLALLQGRFEYMEVGILDNTHLRFFTRRTVEELFARCGYFVEVIERIKLPIFSGSHWIPPINKNSFNNNVINEIEQDEDADTLQFVIQAFPLSLEGKYASLHQQYSTLVEQVDSSQNQLQEIHAELKQSQVQLQDKQCEIKYLQAKMQQTQTQLQQAQEQLKQAQNQQQQTDLEMKRSQCQLQQIEMLWSETQTKLQQAHAGWEHCQNMIKAMESSKFWKLRQAWFKLKRIMNYE